MAYGHFWETNISECGPLIFFQCTTYTIKKSLHATHICFSTVDVYAYINMYWYDGLIANSQEVEVIYDE
jgi:hypothetical protein